MARAKVSVEQNDSVIEVSPATISQVVGSLGDFMVQQFCQRDMFDIRARGCSVIIRTTIRCSPRSRDHIMSRLRQSFCSTDWQLPHEWSQVANG